MTTETEDLHEIYREFTDKSLERYHGMWEAEKHRVGVTPDRIAFAEQSQQAIEAERTQRQGVST